MLRLKTSVRACITAVRMTLPGLRSRHSSRASASQSQHSAPSFGLVHARLKLSLGRAAQGKPSFFCSHSQSYHDSVTFGCTEDVH